MRRLSFFIVSNRPWQLIKTLKTFAKCTRKPLLGNLFAADRIFYGQPRPEDIQYCIVGTYFSFLDFVIRDLSVILESSFDCISDNGL